MPCRPARDRLVAQLRARLRAHDRALLGREPQPKPRQWGLAAEAKRAPHGLRGARHDGRERCRDGTRRRLDSLRLQQLGDELAKHDRLAVGDEVGLAGSALVGREHQPLDHVVDVGRVRELPAAADPGEAPGPHRIGDRWEQGRVAGAPDEPRPQDDGLEALAVGTAHRLLCPRLGRRVGRLRVGPQRGGLVDPDQWLAGDQCRLGPTVDEPAHAGRRAPASAFSVPVTLPATKSSHGPHWPRWAAR